MFAATTEISILTNKHYSITNLKIHNTPQMIPDVAIILTALLRLHLLMKFCARYGDVNWRVNVLLDLKSKTVTSYI